jgi:cytochrome c-type biogenesis protein CcmH
MPNHAPRLFLVAVAAVALGSASCTRKDDASKPAGLPPMPADPAAAPATAPPMPPSPTPSLMPAAAPAPAAAAAPGATTLEAPIDPKAAISGTIELPAKHRGEVSPSDVVFLVARRIADNPQARGTLVAVKRLSATSFPIAFTLSARDMMVPTGGFDGDVSLAARVDKDGDPMTRRKGDIFGGLPKVTVGARGVKVSLDQVQKEDESLAGGGPPPMGGQMNPHAGMPPGHP